VAYQVRVDYALVQCLKDYEAQRLTTLPKSDFRSPIACFQFLQSKIGNLPSKI
jgi:hypothetical protein